MNQNLEVNSHEDPSTCTFRWSRLKQMFEIDILVGIFLLSSHTKLNILAIESPPVKLISDF
jgi:hypothetical protein